MTDDGTIYVGHQDTTVKKYVPVNPAAAAEASAAGGVPFSPRVSTAGGNANTAAGPVRPPDAETDLAFGHVGQVNALVACGPYICSAGTYVPLTWFCSGYSCICTSNPSAPINASAEFVSRHSAAGGTTTVSVWPASVLSFVRVLRGHRGSLAASPFQL